MKTPIILDNGGKTFDRYTIIDRKTGDMWGSSDNPFYPTGFGMYAGNICQQFDPASTLYDYKKGAWPKKWYVKDCVKKWLADSEHIGKPVKLEPLPGDVQKFIKQCLELETV